MKLARELTGQSYPQIAWHFGDRDHTTVLYADRKIRAREETDHRLAARLAECRARIADLVSQRIGKLLSVPAGASSDWTPLPPMKKQGTTPSFRETVIDEILDEIDSLNVHDLDAFLRELGEDPGAVLEAGKAVCKGAIAEEKLARLRNAQRELKSNKTMNAAALLSLDPDRKREVFERIRQRSETSGEMTLAARNKRIEKGRPSASPRQLIKPNGWI